MKKPEPKKATPLSTGAKLALFDVFRRPTPRMFVDESHAKRLIADELVEEYLANSPLSCKPGAAPIKWLRITVEGRSAVHAQITK